MPWADSAHYYCMTELPHATLHGPDLAPEGSLLGEPL